MGTYENVCQSLDSRLDRLERFRKKIFVMDCLLSVFAKLIFIFLTYLYAKHLGYLKPTINFVRELIAEITSIGLWEWFHTTFLYLKKGGLEDVINNGINFVLNSDEQILLIPLIFFSPIPVYVIKKSLIYIFCYPLKLFGYSFDYKDFNKRYKSGVIKELVSSFGQNLDYLPDHMVNQEQFLESGIYGSDIDTYLGEDFVSGYLGKTEISFSELKVWRKVSKKEKEKIFQGLFFIADFNKDFSNKILVRARKSFKISNFFDTVLYRLISGFFIYLVILPWIGVVLNLSFRMAAILLVLTVIGRVFFKMVIAPGMGKIKLENLEFNNLYDVYGDNQQEIRYILTPTMMDKLVDLQIRTKNQISLSFGNSKIFIAIPFEKELFEGDHLRPVKKVLKEDYRLLALVLGIVEELDLNTRIWTKE